MNRYAVCGSLFAAIFFLGVFCYTISRYAGPVSEQAAEAEMTGDIAPAADREMDVPVIHAENTKKQEKKKGFYLRMDGGEVVVYLRDGKTVYEHTGISGHSLPDHELHRLENGYVVKNKKELYSILENFSS